MWDLDTPYVQSRLSEKLGHQAVVRSSCWGGTGYDGLYFIVQDLLAHRKVHVLVFYDEDNVFKNYRNPQASLWFRFGDNADALAGLPIGEQALFYFSAIIGIPRNLLAQLSPVVPAALTSAQPNYMEKMFHTPNPAARLGSVASELGCTPAADGQGFVPFTPPARYQQDEVCVYSATNQNGFLFLNEPLPAWQEHFARKFAELAGQRGCKLVLLSLPQLDTNRPQALRERAFWPAVLHNNLIMLGVPPARLFAGLSDESIYRLYANAGHRNNAYASHFNRNGQQYFTRLMTPALLQIYETSTNR